MKQIFIFVCLVSLVTVVFMSLEKLYERRDSGLYKSETNTAFGEERQVAAEISIPLGPETAFEVSNSPGPELIDQEKNQNPAKLAADNGEVGRAEIEQRVIEAELAGLVGTFFDKTAWRNAGFSTISSLLETYYWAMREGDLNRWLECMSPRENKSWQSLVAGRTEVVAAQLVKSLEEVRDYQIESALNFPDPASVKYVVTVKHLKTNGQQIVERFAVMRIGKEWRVCGEKGYLDYEHHSPEVSKFDALQNTLIR